uniref:Uncharacterized protein n=1 Tax=Anguilla anguilla TaxID=7936 RepID=A0A0E9UW00_ANGAN
MVRGFFRVHLAQRQASGRWLIICWCLLTQPGLCIGLLL